MARKFLTHIDLGKNEFQNAVAQNLGAAPSSPVKGQIYFDTGANVLNWYDGTAWQAAKSGIPAAHAATHNFGGGDALAANGPAGTPTLRKLGTGSTDAAAGDDARFAASPPNGAAGGDLLGSNYPNPVIANGAVTSAKIADGTIVPADVNPLNVDGLDAAASMRTLGLTGGKAMPGRYDISTITLTNPVLNNISMNNNYLTGLPATPPPQGDYAASKAYVDSVAQGLDAKQSVKVASTGNLGLSGLSAIDGVTPAGGDRVLVKDQTTPAQNGIYVANSGAWTRATDADTWNELTSAFTFVEEGTVNADTGWVSTANATGTLNTTAIPWTQFSSTGTVAVGTGLTKAGNTISLDTAYTDGAYVNTNGDAMTGVYQLTGGASTYKVLDGVQNLETRQYGDRFALYNNAATMYGSLSCDPATNKVTLQSTGAYILQLIGPEITVSQAPATTFGVANKGYVDTQVAASGKRYAADVGGGTAVTLAHNLNTRDVVVEVYRNSTPWDRIDCDVERGTVNNVTLRFTVAPAAAEYRAVVLA